MGFDLNSLLDDIFDDGKKSNDSIADIILDGISKQRKKGGRTDGVKKRRPSGHEGTKYLDEHDIDEFYCEFDLDDDDLEDFMS